MYAGPGASPTQAQAEPFAADSPYFPFNATPRPGSRLSPAKAKVMPPAPIRPTVGSAKEEPVTGATTTTLDGQWGVVSFNNFDFYVVLIFTETETLFTK